MQFPLTFNDISLWLAITSMTLLITAELISPYYGKINLYIDRKLLQNTAITMSALFLITVAIRAMMTTTSP